MSKRRDRSKGHQPSPLVYGFHAVESAIQNKAREIEQVLLVDQRRDQRVQQLIHLLDLHSVSYEYVDKQTLEMMCNSENHQGVAIRLKRSVKQKLTIEESIKQLSDNAMVLLLDHIQDPHNLGACLRTAECAGVEMVIVPKDGASPVNETVRKVASGAAENIKIQVVSNLVRAITLLQDAGFWVYGAADQGNTDIYGCEFSQKSAIVMGAEGSGLKRIVKESCDFLINIPMYGTVSSLNVSVATGIVLFEARRQQKI